MLVHLPLVHNPYHYTSYPVYSDNYIVLPLRVRHAPLNRFVKGGVETSVRWATYCYHFVHE